MFVYKITNLINGKCYVGITKKDITRRFKEHVTVSRGNKKKTLIAKAILEYGEHNFKIEEIDGANSLSELFYKEKMWVHKLGCKVPNGYNAIDGGRGNYSDKKHGKVNSGCFTSEKMKGDKNLFYGKKHKQESILKRLEKMKGGITPIYIFNSNRELIFTGNYLSECARYLDCWDVTISTVIKQSRFKYKNYFICYQKEIGKLENFWKTQDEIKNRKKEKKVRIKKYENIQIIELETGVIFKDIYEAADKLFTYPQIILRVLKGEVLSYKNKNYRFVSAELNAYENKRRKLIARKKRVLCINTGEEFQSIAEASAKTGILRTSINNQLKGLSKTAGGLIFKYKL
jgi:hypothetical protein